MFNEETRLRWKQFKQEHYEADRRLVPAALSVLIPFILGLIILIACGVSSCRAEDIRTDIIAKIESSGNVFAKNGEHYGLCQISRGVLHDYNKAHKTMWEVMDLYNGVINLRIADWYLNTEIPRLLKSRHRRDTTLNRISAWRYGIGSGKIARKYCNKYRRMLWNTVC